jgi:hypothetical protein
MAATEGWEHGTPSNPSATYNQFSNENGEEGNDPEQQSNSAQRRFSSGAKSDDDSKHDDDEEDEEEDGDAEEGGSIKIGDYVTIRSIRDRDGALSASGILEDKIK